MFKYLIKVKPLGFLYGSAGAFLSAENLVGKSGAKFPPDAAALSGLILSTYQENTSATKDEIQQLKLNLTVAGAFWAKDDDLASNQNFYVPIPRSHVVGEKDKDFDDWFLEGDQWKRHKKDLEPEFRWQSINSWSKKTDQIKRSTDVSEQPWKFTPILHPYLKNDEKHVKEKDGLFLENAVQMSDDSCLVYLATHTIPDGWYRFGGESHLVEITCQGIKEYSSIFKLLRQKINCHFALITPAVWGTNNLSTRYPKAFKAGAKPPQMLTDRPEAFRYRLGKNDPQNKRASHLGIGRYAVPAGTVYVLKHQLDMTWWDFPNEWFPQSREQVPADYNHNTLLKQLGCGLCLPIEIKIEQKGVD